jgi:adenine-specific DNA-methyltransferase
MTSKLILGDCLDAIKEIKDNSVALVLTDPPYYRIMLNEQDGTKHEWDNQWLSFEAYLTWVRCWALEVKRVLKNNGSFYVFADDRRAYRVRMEIERSGFVLINEIIWVKKNNMTIKGWANYRCYSPITERILFFAVAGSDDVAMSESQYEIACDGLVSKVFSPLREYLIGEKDKVGITLDEVNILVGTASMAGRHYFANSQWCFPTKEHYERMQLTFNVVFKKLKTVGEAGKMSNTELEEVLRQNYEVLRQNYEDLRQNYEDLRRYFNPKANYTDVWTTNLTSCTDIQIHPTQKPISIIRRIIETSSKEGDIVLDLFSGSGTTGVAASNLGRDFIGIEKSEEYFKIAQARIGEAEKQTRLVF